MNIHCIHIEIQGVMKISYFLYYCPVVNRFCLRKYACCHYYATSVSCIMLKCPHSIPTNIIKQNTFQWCFNLTKYWILKLNIYERSINKKKTINTHLRSVFSSIVLAKSAVFLLCAVHQMEWGISQIDWSDGQLFWTRRWRMTFSVLIVLQNSKTKCCCLM